MEQVKFKTNIRCSGCVATVTPYLNETAGNGRWNVDLNDPARTLTVSAVGEKQQAIIKAVEKAGFKAEAI
ncbi:MAG TPA: heavy-metal-associated domain-containing protein [Chryseosolibacter sp.]